MSVELQLLGVKCNLKCTYCYQDPMRLAGNEGGGDYSLEKVKAALLKENASSFAFFGGEALLLPIGDFEEMLKFGKAHGKSMSVQTNATLITDRHIALFKEFQVGIGVSLDGPKELNDAREAKTKGATARTTETSQKNLERLLAEGLPVSLIVTLHKLNASDLRKLTLLEGWIHDLQSRGLKYLNLHPLEVDTAQGRELMLSEQENIDAMRFL